MEQRQGETIMCHYQTLEKASQAMLQAAQAGDWDGVRQFEERCGEVIAQLRVLKMAQPLSPQERPERLRILRSILANDAEVRRLAQPLPGVLDAAASPRGLAG